MLRQSMKLTMVTVPFQGHCKILMKLAKEMLKTNPRLEITFVVTAWNDVRMDDEEVKQLKECGINVVLLNDDKNIQGSAPMKFTFPRVEKLTDSVIDACKNSDYIMYDFFSPEGYIAGKHLNIPTICSMPAIMGAFNRNNTLFQQGLIENESYIHSLEKKYKILLKDKMEMVSDGFFIPSDFQNVIWTWPSLLQAPKDVKSFIDERKQTDKYLFMRLDGEKLDSKHEIIQSAIKLRSSGKKIIYVSLGTVVTKNLWDHEESVRDFANKIFDVVLKNYANRDEDEVIISIGRKVEDIPILKDKPKNFHIYESVPQAELLKQVDLFVTHAGGNSVNDAIDSGTPMVAIPFFGDQHVCAEYIAQKNIGLSFLHEEKERELAINTQSKLFFRKSLNESSLVSAMDKVLRDPSFKKNIQTLKSKSPVTQEMFLRSLQIWKSVGWKEGDLLYGCASDRNKFAELTLHKNYFRLGDMRPFTQLFPNQNGQEILPRIIDQYHDVLTNSENYKKELIDTHSEIYRKTIKEYGDFLRSHPKYLQPIGNLDHITPDKGRAYLETLWNMCLGGIEFFTTVKKQTIHFMMGVFSDKYNEAPIRELQWIKQNWSNDAVREHVKFYTIHQGSVKEVDPEKMSWFSSVRPTPSLIDVAPENAGLNPSKWKKFQNELQAKAQQVNPHLFFNHMKQQYNNELKTFQESKLDVIEVKTHPDFARKSLESGEVYLYALLPKEGLRIVKKYLGETKISHAIAADNKPVICSGEVRMREIHVDGKTRHALDISNDSGHYMPSTIGLPQVISAFEKLNMSVYRVTGVLPGLKDSFDKVDENMKPVFLGR